MTDEIRMVTKESEKRSSIQENSLIKMTEEAQPEKNDLPDDLSEEHDYYLSRDVNELY